MDRTATTDAASRAWVARLQRKAAEHRVPMAAMLELTSRCNLRCQHCYLGSQDEQQRHRDEEMSTAEVLRVIDQLVDVGCLYLTITGGDPMMRRDFVDVYRYAREHGLFVTVFCDGVLVHDRIVDLFRELPPRTVEISLYGATAETYETVTRVPGSYAGAIRGIRRLHAAGFRVSLKTVLLTLNRHELPAMEKMAADWGMPFRFDGAIFPCLPNGDQRPLELRLKPREVVAIEMSSPTRRQAWRRAYEQVQQQPATRHVYTCGAGQSSLYIDPYGRVSPCLMTTHHRYSLRERSLKALWEGELAAVRQKEYQPGDRALPDNLRGVCSHCPGVNRLETGSETNESPFVLELAQLRRDAVMAEKQSATVKTGVSDGS